MVEKRDFSYRLSGVCPNSVSFSLVYDNDDRNPRAWARVRGLSFVGGCSGNLSFMSKVAEEYCSALDFCDVLRGTICGMRGTSCANELAKCIEKAIEEI